jgi:hypothetical protein
MGFYEASENAVFREKAISFFSKFLIWISVMVSDKQKLTKGRFVEWRNY